MAPGASPDGIYSATYSGVPVFEFNVDGNHVMRRRHDDYINATHILKVAEYDKPARTRILEREVQKGVHEKIQGGYGKYQGTWVPLRDGRTLAERNNVLEKLRPIFDYVPGDISPPQAPKHTTNSNKPRIPKVPNVKKIPKPKVNPAYSQISEDYDNISTQLHDDDSLENSTIASASFMEEEDGFGPCAPASRKRKRGQESVLEQQHTLYADALLDYFMLSTSDAPMHLTPPEPPEHFRIDRCIDDQNHTALHWAAAMGDIDIVPFFLARGADQQARNKRGETPLIRAVLFTNNYEKKSMPKLVNQLLQTIKATDHHGASILHHIAMTTNSLVKKKCARYYFDIVLNKLDEFLPPAEFANFINLQDRDGDTALHIVARYNAKRCIRALQGRGVRSDIHNYSKETADRIIQRTRSVHQDFASSSPVPPFSSLADGQDLVKASKPNGTTHYHSQSAISFSHSFTSMAQDKGLQMALAYDSEVRDKDDDLSEGQRLQQQAEDAQRQVRQASFRLYSEGADDYNEEEDHVNREEERRLVTESMSLHEQTGHKDLHHTVRTEEQVLSPAAHRKSNGAISDEANIEKQRLLALDLAAEQKKRRDLTIKVVEAQAAAGMSEHGDKLKRLVSITCSVPTEDVAGLAPELLDELQQSKMEIGSSEVVALA